MLYYKISSSIISHYFISYSKYRPLPLTVQGGPVGLVGWKKIILASLRYFFRQALHRSLAKNSRASKKLKYWLHGAGHV
ncbi:hypothetical protein BACCOPRO_02621 [Phocaeicola coprophilus DSM 18228 = JCM 13818]|jgi:hypothetical protein|uniref:Uncharacterized protein n=2 Tax=Phocaeicola coprophilus TaxID=387090 RepID=S0FBD8_9BACT|nr:hypothetical protein BACCOPRO_02621 [Phocaeicola coprophilus DSM 18228 = JCM 13818]